MPGEREERAFPSKMFETPQQGMTLRDYFAGQVAGPLAVAMLAAYAAAGEAGADTAELVAGLAYEFADAMLERRKA